MLKELFSILRGDTPMNDISENFNEMLRLVQQMCLEASSIYWGKESSKEEQEALYKKDVHVNKLERTIRKQLVTHLTAPGNTADTPYGLLMMSLIKDVERLGDYAKNLQEVSNLFEGNRPTHPLVDELRTIAEQVENLVREASDTFVKSDTQRAWKLTQEGRNVSQQCKAFVGKLAASDLPAAAAVPMVMGVRFYKRIDSHFLNLISSVIMPLHKLDYYDEEAAPTP